MKGKAKKADRQGTGNGEQGTGQHTLPEQPGGIGQAHETILYAANKAAVQDALDKRNAMDLPMLHECHAEAKGDWRRAKIARRIRDLEDVPAEGMPPMTGAETSADVPAEAVPIWPKPEEETKPVSLDRILPIEEDHRAGRTKGQVAAMVESLRLHGLEVPIRLAETAGGRYRIVDGETRRQAAVRLGWTDIPADIHPPMSDAAMHALRATMNLDRLGSTPVDECLTVLAVLHAITNKSEFGQGMTAEASVAVLPPEVAAVAAALGRSERWVRDRLVLARLARVVRELVAAGRLNLGQAREIAKVADFSTQQDLAERFATDEDGVGQVWDLSEVREAVENARWKICGTRWDPTVAYAGRPSCLECPHNTAAVNRLFADKQSIEDGCCMNAACFQAKTYAAEEDLAKAVQKAVKAKAPATAAGCRPFVPDGLKAAAVARQVEKQTETGNPPDGKGGQAGRGGRRTVPERTPERKLQEARGKWSERLRNQIAQAMRKALGKDRKRWAAWNLARHLAEVERLGAYEVRGPKKQAERWRAARALLKAVVEGKADLAALAVQAVGEYRGDEVFFTLHTWSDVALTGFAGLVGVKAAAAPTAKAGLAKDDLPGPDFECDNDCETCSVTDCESRD